MNNTDEVKSIYTDVTLVLEGEGTQRFTVQVAEDFIKIAEIGCGRKLEASRDVSVSVDLQSVMKKLLFIFDSAVGEVLLFPEEQ